MICKHWFGDYLIFAFFFFPPLNLEKRKRNTRACFSVKGWVWRILLEIEHRGHHSGLLVTKICDHTKDSKVCFPAVLSTRQEKHMDAHNTNNTILVICQGVTLKGANDRSTSLKEPSKTDCAGWPLLPSVP